MSSIKIKSLKNNIAIGTAIPTPYTKADNGVGIWAEDQLAENGHNVDTRGTVDLPDLGVENKTKKRGSNSAWTQGSMTINDILATPDFLDTKIWEKMKNQNQITWDGQLQTVVDVELVNMDIEETRELLQESWQDVRDQLLQGSRDKSVTSSNKAMILDGYNNDTSYNIRITTTAMNKIRTISRTNNALNQHFEWK